MYVIEQWLKGKKSFVVGRTLYMTFAKDKAVKKLLQQGETPYAAELLERKMRELLQAPIAVATATKTKETEEMPGSSDPVLERLRNEWQQPYQRMNYLRHQLDSYQGNSMENVAARKEIAFEILELEQQCMQIWEKRDHYLATGSLPDAKPKTPELPTNALELAKMLNSLKKNIGRNRSKMKQYPNVAKYALLYEDYKAQFKRITGHEYNEKN